MKKIWIIESKDFPTHLSLSTSGCSPSYPTAPPGRPGRLLTVAVEAGAFAAGAVPGILMSWWRLLNDFYWKPPFTQILEKKNTGNLPSTVESQKAVIFGGTCSFGGAWTACLGGLNCTLEERVLVNKWQLSNHHGNGIVYVHICWHLEWLSTASKLLARFWSKPRNPFSSMYLLMCPLLGTGTETVCCWVRNYSPVALHLWQSWLLCDQLPQSVVPCHPGIYLKLWLYSYQWYLVSTFQYLIFDTGPHLPTSRFSSSGFIPQFQLLEVSCW